jgi:hypothetical protein
VWHRATIVRGSCRFAVVVRVLWIWVVLVATASAEPHRAGGLIWHAPTACPDIDEVRARIEHRLGAPIEAMVHGIEAEITAAVGAHGFVARVDLRGLGAGNSIRVLTAARCDELTDAIAVIIARLAAAASEAAPAGPAAPELAVQAPIAELPRPWGAGVRVLGTTGIGAQPRVGSGAELGIYGRHGAMFADLAVARWQPTSQVLHPGAPARVEVQLRTVALRLGWRPEQLPLRAWLTGELGTLRGEGIALGDSVVGSGTWGSVGAGFGVAWPMLRYARLVGAIELAVPVRAIRFVLRDGMELYRSEPATARCGVGLEVGWP